MTASVVFEVPGMTCAHCEAAVTAELRVVEGVDDVRVDLNAKRVDLNSTALDDPALRRAIADAGYEAS